VVTFDDGLLVAINEFARRTWWLQWPMYDYATYGVALFAVLLLAGWWAARRPGEPARIAAAGWAGLGTVLAVGINQPLVNAIHEARPYTSMPHLFVLADPSSDFSFPSDHATMAGAVAAGLFLIRRRFGWVATVAAVVIAFARVYIAAHYPHDVAAGLVLGAAVVGLGWLALRGVLTASVRALARTPLRPLVTATPLAGSASTASGETTERTGSATAVVWPRMRPPT
jgi:undecaprenyl-diphosphatase